MESLRSLSSDLLTANECITAIMVVIFHLGIPGNFTTKNLFANFIFMLIPIIIGYFFIIFHNTNIRLFFQISNLSSGLFIWTNPLVVTYVNFRGPAALMTQQLLNILLHPDALPPRQSGTRRKAKGKR